MALPLPTPKGLLADKGYDGDRFCENLLMRGILPIIPPRSNRKAPEHPDYSRYKDRNRVERMFAKLKQQRRIATRYDKTILSFESFLNLAAARLWLKSFVNTASEINCLKIPRLGTLTKNPLVRGNIFSTLNLRWPTLALARVRTY